MPILLLPPAIPQRAKLAKLCLPHATNENRTFEFQPYSFLPRLAMNKIPKITLLNFKKFQTFEVDFKRDLNLFIGDNEAGKSSILPAIDLAISGSRTKVETIGLEHLFNIVAIKEFLNQTENIINCRS